MSPYVKFLTKTDNKPVYEQTNGYKKQMFTYMAEQMPLLRTRFTEMFRSYKQEILSKAKETPEKPDEGEENPVKKEPFYKFDQSGYRLISFPKHKKQFAIKTEYSQSNNEHRLFVYCVEDNLMVLKREFVIRSGGSAISCWLTNDLVTYKIDKHHLFFFRLIAGVTWSFEMIKYNLLKDEEKVVME